MSLCFDRAHVLTACNDMTLFEVFDVFQLSKPLVTLAGLNTKV